MPAADPVENLLIAQFFHLRSRMGGVWIFTLFLVVAAVSFGYVVAGTASSVNAPNPGARHLPGNG
jgi:hypothetical protein